MIRKIAQSALCMFLAPLLIAQQTAAAGAAPIDDKPATAPEFITLAQGTELHLILLEDVSSATATKGKKVRMAVAQDVTVDGKIAIPNGTAVEGEVSHVTKAVSGKRNGLIEIKPLAVIFADGTRMRLGDYPPGEDACGDFGPCWAMWIFFAPFLPLVFISLAANTKGAGQLKEAGNEATESACSSEYGYTRTATRLSVVSPGSADLSASAALALCPHHAIK